MSDSRQAPNRGVSGSANTKSRESASRTQTYATPGAEARQYSGRHINTFANITQNPFSRPRRGNAARSTEQSTATSPGVARTRQHHYSVQRAEKESRLHLDCEMARNKEHALAVLRNEHSDKCDILSRIPAVRDRLDLRAEVQRDQVQRHHPTKNMDHTAAADGVYDTQHCRPDERHITFHRGNLPVFQKQRSSPPVVQHVLQHANVQSMTQPAQSSGSERNYPVTSTLIESGPTIGPATGNTDTVTSTTATPPFSVPTPSYPRDQQPYAENQGDMMNRSSSPPPRQTRLRPAAPTDESYYYNVSMFDEPSHYRRSRNEDPAVSYIDPTDETQYNGDAMIISDQQTRADNDEPLVIEDSRITISDNLICVENSQRQQQVEGLSALPTSLGSVRISPTNESLGADTTEYMELPAQICAPSEQQRSSLFQCLAQKLSSSYNFISSLVAPQRAADALAQSAEPRCDASFISDGVSECANAERRGPIQFEDADKRDVPENQYSHVRKEEIENLVKDNYSPGIIQDTIDGRENFNRYSFEISLAQDPQDAVDCSDPMTLLEAFAIRIDKERAQISEAVTESATADKIAELVKQYFANQNPSDLNRSIKNLLLAERLQDHEQNEKSKNIPFEAEVQKWITTWPNSEVKLIAYTGRTKPGNA